MAVASVMGIPPCPFQIQSVFGESLPRGHLGIVGSAEELGGEHGPIRIDDGSHPSVGPIRAAHRVVVVAGVPPQGYKSLGDLRLVSVRFDPSDVLTGTLHIENPDCDERSTGVPHVADVFSIDGEGAAVLTEVFTVLLRQTVQSRVSFERWCADRLPIGIDVIEDQIGL